MGKDLQSDLDTTRGSGVPDFEKFSAYNGGPRSKEVDRILAPLFRNGTGSHRSRPSYASENTLLVRRYSSCCVHAQMSGRAAQTLPVSARLFLIDQGHCQQRLSILAS